MVTGPREQRKRRHRGFHAGIFPVIIVGRPAPASLWRRGERINKFRGQGVYSIGTENISVKFRRFR